MPEWVVSRSRANVLNPDCTLESFGELLKTVSERFFSQIFRFTHCKYVCVCVCVCVHINTQHDYPLQYSGLENPWLEEPDRLQSMESQRVRHD